VAGVTMTKKKQQKPPSLADKAQEARDGARRQRREEDATTLEMSDRVNLGDHPDQVGEILVTRGLITRHQLFNALNESYRTGATLGEALIALGFVERGALEEALRSGKG